MRASGLSPTPRMSLDFKLFQGASFHLNDSVPHEHQQKVSMISAMPAVKQMWPLRMYPVPSVPRRNVMANPNGTITRLDDSPLTNEDATQKKDAFSTHVMTQVDRLHAEGSKFILDPRSGHTCFHRPSPPYCSLLHKAKIPLAAARPCPFLVRTSIC